MGVATELSAADSSLLNGCQQGCWHDTLGAGRCFGGGMIPSSGMSTRVYPWVYMMSMAHLKDAFDMYLHQQD